MDNDQLLTSNGWIQQPDGKWQRELSPNSTVCLLEETAVEFTKAEAHTKKEIWPDGEPSPRPFGTSLSEREKQTL